MYSLSHTETHAGVLGFSGLKCVLFASALSHIASAHASLPQRERWGGGGSIFSSPFFGDNDDHFFFSVTDDRQN